MISNLIKIYKEREIRVYKEREIRVYYLLIRNLPIHLSSIINL